MKLDELNTKVQMLEQENEQVAKLLSKFDATIDKLSEFSMSINKLLAVHEERLSTQRAKTDELVVTMEKRREDYTRGFSDLNSKIDQVENELRHEGNDHYNKLLSEFKDLNKCIEKNAKISASNTATTTTQIDNLQSQVEKLEESNSKRDAKIEKMLKFSYISIGVITVVYFLATGTLPISFS